MVLHLCANLRGGMLRGRALAGKSRPKAGGRNRRGRRRREPGRGRGIRSGLSELFGGVKGEPVQTGLSAVRILFKLLDFY